MTTAKMLEPTPERGMLEGVSRMLQMDPKVYIFYILAVFKARVIRFNRVAWTTPGLLYHTKLSGLGFDI